MIKDLLPTDPVAVGPYRLLGRLGRGGMGQVYLGRSAGGRRVAVKVIRPEYAEEPGFRVRFAREVAAARGVSGMFTALVIDADTDTDDPWLATAYVPGPSLAEAVVDGGPLPTRTLFGLAAGLAEALQAIHAAGLVHRDLKPSNVLLAADGPRVIDFGISRAREAASLTTTGMIVGSPGFLSPEQAEGTAVGPPSDIFSLGGVLTYAATGEGPFGTGYTAALLYRVVNREPELSAVPAEIRPMVERCLAKDPAARPTPGEILAELEESGVDVGVATPEWLPASVVGDLSRYVPTVQSPETPADGAEPPVFEEPPSAAQSPSAQTPPVSADPSGDGRTAASEASAAAPSGEPVNAAAASGELPTVGLAAVPGGARDAGNSAGADPPGPAGQRGGGLVTPGRRRLIVAASVAVVVLAGLGAGLGLSGSGPGKPTGGPTPSVDVSASSATARPSVTPTHRASVAAVATRKPAKAKTPKSHKSAAKHPASPSSGNTPTQDSGGVPATQAATQGPTTAPSSPAPKPAPTHTTPPTQEVSGVSGADQNYTCSDIGGIGSTPGGSAVPFSFDNSSSADVTVYYITSADQSEAYDTIPPDGSYSANAAQDQVWWLQSASGDCLGVFTIVGSGQVSVS